MIYYLIYININLKTLYCSGDDNGTNASTIKILIKSYSSLDNLENTNKISFSWLFGNKAIKFFYYIFNL